MMDDAALWIVAGLGIAVTLMCMYCIGGPLPSQSWRDWWDEWVSWWKS